MARRRPQRRKQELRLAPASPPKRKRRISSDQTIRSLPKKSLSDLVRIWRNALVLQDDPVQKREIDRLINAIGREWKRRSLSFNPDDYFKWPTTDIFAGGGGLATRGWPTDGLLKFMEYHVGRTQGVAPPMRQAILREVFQGELPPVDSPQYMAQWGSPKSAGRLKKLAESIAAFTRNAKHRRDSLLDDAVGDWEHDLQFLYEEFYVGHFHFAWPSAIV